MTAPTDLQELDVIMVAGNRFTVGPAANDITGDEVDVQVFDALGNRCTVTLDNRLDYDVIERAEALPSKPDAK